jgi:hypothetical protein
VAALGTEVVSDLRRATAVHHDRRPEPSATNTANAGSPKYQRNVAVTSTANDGWKTFTQQCRTISMIVWKRQSTELRRTSGTVGRYRCDQRQIRSSIAGTVNAWSCRPRRPAGCRVPPTRLVRWKVMTERCRLSSVGTPTTPLRQEDGGALIWSLVDKNCRRASSVKMRTVRTGLMAERKHSWPW